MSRPRIAVSVIIPTYRRESELVNTLIALTKQVRDGDELLVVDQTPSHDPQTNVALRQLAAQGLLRWYRKRRPSQGEGMNVGAQLARGDVLLFLDDDIIPSPDLVEGHRQAFLDDVATEATCGQVLQPWNAGPVDSVRGFDISFDFAYSRRCDIVALIGANFAMRKDVYLSIGGMDENFRGNNYRNDAELAYRLHRMTGRKVTFLPGASVRHLLAGGGNRAFGYKDSWGAIGGSIGDYYFALRCLALGDAVAHSLTRLVRAPVNRRTLSRPWLIPWLTIRELVALVAASYRVLAAPDNFAKALTAYSDLEPAG